MTRDLNDLDLSELERELELEMDDDAELTDDRGIERELEILTEFEEEPEGEFEEVEQETGDDYAERFYELSTRAFESESEVDAAVNDLLGEMEREYFWGGLKKALKKVPVKKLLKKGLSVVKGLALKHPALQGLKSLTQLARGNLKGMLGSFAKTAITTLLSSHPAGAAILPALRALGFEATEDPEVNRAAWQNFVEVSREAFDHLGTSMTEIADEPLEASRLATNAFQAAFRRAQINPNATGLKRKQYRIYIRRGEEVTVIIKGQ